MIEDRFGELRGAFGFLDGCRWEIQSCRDPQIQNAYYNGWTSSHNIANLFAFAPDGCIIYSVLNCPGSWNDARLARDGGLYDVLSQVNDDEFLIADSIFPSSAESEHLMGGQKIRRPPRENELQLPSTPEEVHFLWALVAARQSAEWGVASLNRSFPRIRSPWRWTPLDDLHRHRRKNTIETMVHLHNFRTRRMGRNQIRTVWDFTFDPEDY
jgi:hypothetical protein